MLAYSLSCLVSELNTWKRTPSKATSVQNNLKASFWEAVPISFLGDQQIGAENSEPQERSRSPHCKYVKCTLCIFIFADYTALSMGLKVYIVRRLTHTLITLWAFATVLFVLFRIIPGYPTGRYGTVGLTAEQRQEMLQQMGLNEPLHVQYYKFIANLLQGDFGISYTYRKPVWEVLIEKLRNTVILMGPTLVLAILLGVFIGALLGYKRDSLFEKGGIIVTITARSSPEFLTGLVLIMIFVFGLGLFPPGGISSIGSTTTGFELFLSWEFVRHAALPVLTGVIAYSTLPILLMRNTLLEVMDSNFVEIKRAEGIPPRVILYKHIVRNSLLPIVTITALASGLVIGGSVIIETVFNWPGMGREMIRAVTFDDYPLAQGLFFFLGSIVIIMNFIADILYVYVDPRIRYD
jgi:peptide/nickel transport system permease protein